MECYSIQWLDQLQLLLLCKYVTCLFVFLSIRLSMMLRISVTVYQPTFPIPCIICYVDVPHLLFGYKAFDWVESPFQNNHRNIDHIYLSYNSAPGLIQG